ncbi:hypothetical protein K438DRAFT_2001413 [Mycena galopus ATCC 62051]|nr:hypothetical protein K438DRAFT_2001413 [Mycena galopus ATCC 62051]
MLALWCILLAAVCLGPTHVAALLTGELGSFASPKTGVKWRYWIQDASVNLDNVASDIAQIASVGSSGFELLSYQTYGGTTILDPTDYAFGSNRFVDVAAAAVQAAIDNNVTIDFAMGPDQGAGVPVFPQDVDMEGLNTELAFGAIFLSPGEKFSGILPPPQVFPEPNNPTANITKFALVSAIVAELVPGADPTASRVSLEWNTVQELTSDVDKSFNVSFTAPNASSVLLAYYSRRNGYPEAEGGFNGSFPNLPGSWGSYVVDHFSAKGAQVTIDFIEQNILAQQGIGALAALPNVGSYVWEDSMEFWAQLFWTDGLPQRFLERHGYEINKTLPVVSTISVGCAYNFTIRMYLHLSEFPVAAKPAQSFDFGTTVESGRFLEDYKDTLTSLYVDHMQTYNNWSHTIGMQFSNQPGYNFPLDVAASAAVPDTPEIETLAILTVDEARQLSGGVHLGGHVIMSSEVGANFGQASSMRMADLLNDAYIQYAGGVNVALLHGFPYSGPTAGCTWPGFTTFDYNFAEMHGPRNPAWGHYKEYMDVLKHTQYALRSGVAKVDVAVYRKDYDVTPYTSPPFETSSLFNLGYTYEYISPENLKLPGVSVSNGRLAPSGPAYKVLILNRQMNLTLDAAQSILEYSKAGLPIVISGSVPNDVPGFDPTGTQAGQVQALMQELIGQSNVRVVTDENAVPAALVSLGIVPALSFSTPDGLYSIRRDTEDVSFFWLYNPQFGSESFTLTLKPDISGTPFLLDPWTAEVSPVALWTKNPSGAISIPSITLQSSEAILFAVSSASTFEGVDVPSAHLEVLDSPASAVGDADGNIEVQSPSDGTFAYTLSTGQTGSVDVSLAGETTRTLSGWELSLVAWTPPANLSLGGSVASVLVTQPTFNLTQGLVAWNTLEGQETTSGVGTYTTTFQWNDHNNTVGVQLDFGYIFHTVKAWVNGVQIPTADPTSPVVDITQFIIAGANSLRIEAASTLLNALSGVPNVETLDDLRTKLGIIPANQAYGLTDPVQLIPYGRATIMI